MDRARFRPLPLAVALAAFALNLIFVPPRKAPDAPCERGPSAAAAATPREAAAQMATKPPQAHARTAAPAAEPTPAGITRPAQREVVLMRGIGSVRVTAYENDDEARLVLEDDATGEKLESVTMAGGSRNPELRFRVLHVKGLPDPLVVGLARSPGGSDSGWEAVAFGPVGGELEEVTGFERLRTGDRGGFHFGDLGGGLGPGAAVWTDVWDPEYEGHPSPHRYEVTLYRWSSVNARFEWHKVFRTRGKFGTGDEALRASGLRFRDVRRGVADFGYLEEEYGERGAAR